MTSALNTVRSRAQLQTDESGSWGFGAVLVSATPWRGFAAGCTPAWQSCSIAPKEMYPVLAACLLWGKSWIGSTVRLESDNSTVVAACNAGSTRYGALLRLLRALMMSSAQFNCTIRAEHLPGAQNLVADALSRGEPTLSVLQGKRLELEELPEKILAALDKLATADPVWGSPS